MPANEPIQQGPYPLPADPPDGPNQMSAIVAWAAGRFMMRFASEAARDAAIPSPTDGMVCTTGSGSTLRFWACKSGAWADIFAVIGPEDADWTPCVFEDGFSGTLEVCSVGRVVEIRGSFSGPMPLQNTVVASLPPGPFAPSGTLARPNVYWTAAATDIGYVASSGIIGVTNTTDLVRTSCQMRGVWTRD